MKSIFFIGSKEFQTIRVCLLIFESIDITIKTAAFLDIKYSQGGPAGVSYRSLTFMCRVKGLLYELKYNILVDVGCNTVPPHFRAKSVFRSFYGN